MRALLLIALSTHLFACNMAKYQGREGYDASCPNLIEYPCKPSALGSAATMPACVLDPAATNKLAKEIPPDASYPVGCTVILADPTPDEIGQCTIAGTCNCADAGTWICQGH
jgi:hypothetical protein